MISKENFELAKPSLDFQTKERGIKFYSSRECWDTFFGWKKRERRILKGSKGFVVEIVFPYIKKKNGGINVYGFHHKRATLFSIDQTV